MMKRMIKSITKEQTKGMTIVEVIVSFAIIAIICIVVISCFATAGNISAKSSIKERNTAELTLDIESKEQLKQDVPSEKVKIKSGTYEMNVIINTYTSKDNQESIRIFSYEPSK